MGGEGRFTEENSSVDFAFIRISCYTTFMQSLEKKDYPKDFSYHRTASPTYRAYLETCGLSTFDIGHPPQFAWKKKIFGNWFWVIKYERITYTPDIEYLKKTTGFKHAFVVWIPYGEVKIEKPWRRLWATDHFEETGYAELVQNEKRKVKSAEQESQISSWANQQTSKTANYLLSWNERSKRARKKFLALWAIVKEVSPDIFVEGFRTTRVKHWYKWAYISYYKRMVSLDASKVRQWLAYDPSGKVIGGLAVHDFLEDHSVHLVAFTDTKSYDLQAGTGLMDAWFADSYEKGMKYLSVDHLRNKNGPRDQKGYTAFKENFITAQLSFKEAYFRFF
jgi:hypothetical protein